VFRWLEDQEIESLNVLEISDNNENGYILEVDLNYPPELHDHHNEYLKVTTGIVVGYVSVVDFGVSMRNGRNTTS
jgi:hypothetical protein